MAHREVVPLFGGQAIRHEERFGLMPHQTADEGTVGTGDQLSDSM